MLHVLIGDQADMDVILHVLEGDGVTPWVVPKGARPGDSVLIFFRHTGSMIGTGEIVSIPEPGLFGKRHVHRANIAIGHGLNPGITLEELSTVVPDWAWLRYPRTYTTPADDIAKLLEAFVLKRIESDGEEMPEEVHEASEYFEGSVKQVLVNRYERDRSARERCIEHYGSMCCVCGFDFSAFYGEEMDGFIHVHHIRPLASIGATYSVDPIQDMRPVCPNCHAAIHYRDPPFLPEELATVLGIKRKGI